MNTTTYTISYRKVMILAITLFVTLLLTYAVLMNAVVSTSKKLVGLQDSLVSMQTKITQTEQEIVALKRSVTKEYALLSGFIEAENVAYIKTDTTKTAFLNE
jgi:cell division protein FtsL